MVDLVFSDRTVEAVPPSYWIAGLRPHIFPVSQVRRGLLLRGGVHGPSGRVAAMSVGLPMLSGSWSFGFCRGLDSARRSPCHLGLGFPF